MSAYLFSRIILLLTVGAYVVDGPAATSGTLQAVATRNRVFWQATDPQPMKLSLNALSFEKCRAEDQVVCPETHSYPIWWNTEQPVLWRVADNHVWALATHTFLDPVPEYWVYRIPLESFLAGFKGRRINDSDNLLVKIFEPLGSKLIVSRSPFLVDFVPIGDSTIRLFVLDWEAEKTITSWEWNQKAPDPHATVDKPADKGTSAWKRIESYRSEFFEPFSIYLQPNGPMAITHTGQVFAVRETRPGSLAFQREKPLGIIVAVVEDVETGDVIVFTKEVCYRVKDPGRLHLFQFPFGPRDDDKLASALLDAVRRARARR